MDPATLTTATFTLRKQGATADVAATVSYNVSSNTATLQPSAALEGSSLYNATLTTGVKGAAGNALAAVVTWSFTTADSSAPTVTGRTPLPGATGVATNSAVTAEFSEAMDPATLTTATFTLVRQSTGTAVAGTVTYSAMTRIATLQPATALANNVVYLATVKGGAAGVRDTAGNPLAADASWSFTTAPDTTAPTITNLTPVPDATNAALNAVITAEFSEAMDPATVNGTQFTLTTQSTGAAIAATVTYDEGSRTARLQPLAALETRTFYVATVKGGAAGARDTAGNPLSADVTWNFRTRPN
jgi:hypothetical protein